MRKRRTKSVALVTKSGGLSRDSNDEKGLSEWALPPDSRAGELPIPIDHSRALVNLRPQRDLVVIVALPRYPVLRLSQTIQCFS